MKIVILGKNGQLGKELNSCLLKNKYKVIAYDKKELDILEYKKVSSQITKEKPDVVINTTAFHVTTECELYPEKAFAVNAFALKNLSEVCNLNKTRLVTYSTDYVFDGNKGKPYVESDKPNPLQIYGMSKYLGEMICQKYANDYIIIRTSGIYGGKLGSKSKKGNFILNIIQQSKKVKKLEVSKEQTISSTYAADLAKATQEVIEKKIPSGIYHLVNTELCTWADLAKYVIEENAIDCIIKPINRKGGANEMNRPLFSALANTKAKKFGIILPDWKSAVKKYLLSIN